MAVGNAVARYPRRGVRYYGGEFTGAAGSISGVKFKSEMTVTYAGAGLYTFQCVEGPNQVPARPGAVCRLADVDMTTVNLSNTAQGGWAWTVAADNLNTNGSFQIKTFALAGTAADLQVLTKFWITIELEAA